MIDPARTILRALKGAPLSILIALFIEGSPLLKKRMETLTGYNSDSIQKGVEVLLALGLIAPSGKAWVLTTAAWQLPLPFDSSKQPRFSLPPVIVAENQISEINPSPKKSELSETVVVEDIDDKELKDHLLLLLKANATPKKSEFANLEKIRLGDASSLIKRNLIRAMRVSNVYESVSKRLANRILSGEISLTTLDILGLLNQFSHSKSVREVGGVMASHIADGTQPSEKFRPPTADIEKALQWVKCKSGAEREQLELSWETAWYWVCPECECEIDGPEMFIPEAGHCEECGAKLFRRDWDRIKWNLANDIEDRDRHDTQH